MKIEYNVIIRDDYGDEHLVVRHGNVREAIKDHIIVEDDIIEYIDNYSGFAPVDQYHRDNPNKRFDCVIEVTYY